jgi:hypothetical protein
MRRILASLLLLGLFALTSASLVGCSGEDTSKPAAPANPPAGGGAPAPGGAGGETTK